jgi:hypothetical protein
VQAPSGSFVKNLFNSLEHLLLTGTEGIPCPINFWNVEEFVSLDRSDLVQLVSANF